MSVAERVLELGRRPHTRVVVSCRLGARGGAPIGTRAIGAPVAIVEALGDFSMRRCAAGYAGNERLVSATNAADRRH